MKKHRPVHLTQYTNTILGKQAFEHEMAKNGCAIIAYCADNGIFAGNAFKNKITKSEQSISYCGVGRHHQNALAENCIGILCQNVQAMLLHATLLWPFALNTNLWPFALCLSNDICNLQPHEDGNCYLNCLSLSDVNPSLQIIIPLAVQLWYLMIASQILETVYQNGSNAVGLVHTWETQNTTLPVYLLFSI